MKVFIASCVVLLLVIGTVVMSAFYVYETMDRLDADAADMPASLDSAEDIEKAGRIIRGAEEYWAGRSFSVSLSLSHKETEYIELAIGRIRAALDAEDSGSYAEALSSFRHYVRRLRDEEKLSAENML